VIEKCLDRVNKKRNTIVVVRGRIEERRSVSAESTSNNAARRLKLAGQRAELSILESALAKLDREVDKALIHGTLQTPPCRPRMLRNLGPLKRGLFCLHRDENAVANVA
jgi:hypothetical protein